MNNEMSLDEKYDLAIKTIYLSLTTTWEDNGNIMADAVIDSVLSNLSAMTGESIESILAKVERTVADNQ